MFIFPFPAQYKFYLHVAGCSFKYWPTQIIWWTKKDYFQVKNFFGGKILHVLLHAKSCLNSKALDEVICYFLLSLFSRQTCFWFNSRLPGIVYSPAVVCPHCTILKLCPYFLKQLSLCAEPSSDGHLALVREKRNVSPATPASWKPAWEGCG